MPVPSLNEKGQYAFTDAQQIIMEKVCNAMAEVGAVPKRAQNKHGGYFYATADDVYDSVRKILAKAGLVPKSTQTDCQIEHVGEGKDRKTWLRIDFALKFLGEETPDEKTIMLQFFGPQSFQAASTYALKYWLRDRLLLSTGEGDLDNYETDPDSTPDQQPPALRRASTVGLHSNRVDDIMGAISSPKEARKVGTILGKFKKHPGDESVKSLRAAIASLTPAEAAQVEKAIFEV